MCLSKLHIKRFFGLGLLTLCWSLGVINAAPEPHIDRMEYIVWNDGGQLSAYKKSKYLKDATRLALRLQSANGDYSRLRAEAPKEMVTSIYDALVAVHNSDHEKARLVTATHKLHTFPIPNVDQFFIVYKRTAEWAMPLRLGDNTTDSDLINNLLDRYGLIIDKNVEWDEEHNSFNVRAKKSLNLAPVAQAFSNIDGIVLVDLLMPEGDGNDIELKKLANGWELSYLVKFDSCISGCKKKHVWKFRVDNSNKVTFVEEIGDELPDWMAGE